MDYEHAKKLLIHEGTSDEGIHVCVRGNTDPGHERMMRIVEAVEVLIATDDLTAPIDRRLAYALYVVCSKRMSNRIHGKKPNLGETAASIMTLSRSK